LQFYRDAARFLVAMAKTAMPAQMTFTKVDG